MSGPTLRAACVQVNAGLEVEPNLEIAADLARKAAKDGADLITFPENVACIAHGRRKLIARAFDPVDNTALAFFQDLAQEVGAWLLIGSLHVRVSSEKAANRCFLIDPAGTVTATYDKIHMFDVDLQGGESYRESAIFEPGRQAVLADLPQARLGLTICYDVRFAALYRALAHGGATIMSVPAAFTKKTGQAHWHTLLTARAIETGSFIIAPAQTGTHDEGRETYGHSLIVAPWGEVLADAGSEVGVVVADLDMSLVDKARQAVPALTHDVEIALPEVEPATPLPLRASL
ncbi:MAG: carbon-nitrogen hydrolase family protein [Pseudomonadota bacterium]